MTRNLVICCDGTGNQFDSINTNVVRIAQIIDRDPTKQRLYYDPGVGTLPEPGAWGTVHQKASQLLGLTSGAGIMWKVQQAYTYLMNTWEPEDLIFLFGFSRGAYTVRLLAGMLHSLGLMPRGNENLVPYVAKIYQAFSDGKVNKWKNLCDDFRLSFALPMPKNNERRCCVHFLGVWDTVSSIGWLWDPPAFPFTEHNPSISTIRHAISVDERRYFFRHNLMQKTGNQDFKQYWFPGVHCDIGGGYPEEESCLWRTSFEWILEEAEKSNLLIDNKRLQKILNKPHASINPWTDSQHESLKRWWWLAEFFPKLVWIRGRSWRIPQLGLGQHRRIPNKALIHKSTLLRIREMNYEPPNLSKKFLAKVRALPEIPETLPYKHN